METKQVSIHFRIPRTVDKPARRQFSESRGAFGGIPITAKENADSSGEVIDHRMTGWGVGSGTRDRGEATDLKSREKIN